MNTSRRTPYHIDGKDYKFSQPKTRQVFHDKLQNIKEEKKQHEIKYTAEQFRNDIEDKYNIGAESIRSYISNSKATWPPIDKLKDLAEAFGCKITDLLEEIPQEKTEVLLMIKEYTEKDKELVVTVYNEIISSVPLLAKIKTGYIPRTLKKEEKYIDEQVDDFIIHLITTVHTDAIFTSDKELELLDTIIQEIIEFTSTSPYEMPSRWEDLSNDDMQELACVITDHEQARISDDSTEEEMKKTSIYKYLRKKFPSANISDFNAFYYQYNLERLYYMELANLIRLVFMADFSYMFEEM